jgi:hypothetical protein
MADWLLELTMMTGALAMAVDDKLAPDTATANARRVDALLKNKAYKHNALRLHFKGEPSEEDPPGLPLGHTLPYTFRTVREGGIDRVEFCHQGARYPVSRWTMVEDSARAEAYQALARSHGEAVRYKATAYIEAGGLQPRLIALRHKLYFLNSLGAWEKRFDLLLDGARGSINRSEVEAGKRAIESLAP